MYYDGTQSCGIPTLQSCEQSVLGRRRNLPDRRFRRNSGKSVPALARRAAGRPEAIVARTRRRAAAARPFADADRAGRAAAPDVLRAIFRRHVVLRYPDASGLRGFGPRRRWRLPQSIGIGRPIDRSRCGSSFRNARGTHAGPSPEGAGEVGRIGIANQIGDFQHAEPAARQHPHRLVLSNVVEHFLERDAPIVQASLQVRAPIRINCEMRSLVGPLDTAVSRGSRSRHRAPNRYARRRAAAPGEGGPTTLRDR